MPTHSHEANEPIKFDRWCFASIEQFINTQFAFGVAILLPIVCLGGTLLREFNTVSHSARPYATGKLYWYRTSVVINRVPAPQKMADAVPERSAPGTELVES